MGATSSVPGMFEISAEALNTPSECVPAKRPMMTSAERSFRKASTFCVTSHLEMCIRSAAAASDSRGRKGCRM